MELSTLALALAGANGISGLENQAAELGRSYLEALGPCEITPLGSVVCRVKKAGPEKPHLLLTAHIDEIGLIVTSIDDKGFLRVAGCGGIDRAALPAAPVVVHAAGGDLDGVVCSIPPHLNPDESKLPKIEDLSIDVGLSAEEAKEQIAPGDRVSIGYEAVKLLGDKLSCKTLDDRAGCAAVIAAAEQLSQCSLDCSLSVLLATMEEVGSQGARTGAAALSPTHAIVVDVSFARAPGIPVEKSGALGKGVMLGMAPVLDNTMFQTIKEIAAREKIPYQLEVMGGATGTDVDAVAIAGAGVRCAMLSVPLRNMHTPVEVVSTADIGAVANLIAAYAKEEFGGACNG